MTCAAPALHALPSSRPLPPGLAELGRAAAEVRDLIFDAMSVLGRIGEFAHSPLNMVIAEILGSWRSDRGEALFALDFTSTPSGGYQLSRTSAPWSLLGESLLVSRDLHRPVGEWFERRLGRLGSISLRAPTELLSDPAVRQLARVLAARKLDVQFAQLDAGWDDAPELSGAAFLASYVGCFLGDFTLPDHGTRLAFPLWTVLLDDPAFLLTLNTFYPHHPLIPDAALAAASEGGRTLSDQIGVDLDYNIGVVQDWGGVDASGPIDLIRVFVSLTTVLGAVRLNGAHPHIIQSGVVTQLET